VFFLLIKKYAAHFLTQRERNLIFNRLYKKYLTIEETYLAVDTMKLVQEKFGLIEISDVDWEAYGLTGQPKSFGPAASDLAQATEEYFRRFYGCASAALYNANLAEGGFFKPVRISRSDFGSLYETEQRPLEGYDRWDGPPFWLTGG
jgi:hypothetical protein